jgi:hypothetical protein
MSQLSLYSDSYDGIDPSDSISSVQLPYPLLPPPPLPPAIRTIKLQTFEYAIWTKVESRNFVDWWLKTQYGTKPASNSMKWDRKRQSSEIWVSLQQVASLQTGEPKVMCIHCNTLLVHPNWKATGTNTVRRHLQSCLIRVKRPSIQHLMQKAVNRSFFFLSHLFTLSFFQTKSS